MQSDSVSDLSTTQESGIENRGIFARICHYITSGTEKVGDIGDYLVTSAQKDLYNLKDKLVNSWQISPEEKDTLALYITAVISRICYTPLILVTTLISSISKIVLGSVCMILGFRFLTLCSRLFNTMWEVVKQGCEITGTLFKRLFSNILDVLATAAKKFGEICARINAAIMRNFIWAFNKIAEIFNHFCTFIYDGIKVIWNAGFSLASGCVNGIAILVTAIVMGIGAVFFETGASNITSGIAKLVFTLNEGIATTIGAILDGAHDCGENILTGVRKLFGYRPTIASNQESYVHQPLLNELDHENSDVEQNLPANIIPVPQLVTARPGLFFVGTIGVRSEYFRETLYGLAHNLTTSVSSTGTSIQNSYFSNRADLFGDRSAGSAIERSAASEVRPRFIA